MWNLENNTLFAAERTWVRDEIGAETWIVAVKGSFLIGPDNMLAINPEQEPVCRTPVFGGDPASASLLAESDLIHTKLRTDVLVRGQAYAPRCRPAERVAVRLRLANIDKTLSVHGDRAVEGGFLGVGASAAEPFTTMPIVYERSFGGSDTVAEDPRHHGAEQRNPVGTGFAKRPQHVLGSLAPNIEYPDSPYRSCDRGRPAGFGPIARHWQPRLGMAGTYDGTWEEERLPLLPLDFDRRFYQCAPEDQQADGYLRGGERVRIENMTPDGELVFDLPRVSLAFSTRLGSERVTHRGVLHTVLIEPDLRQVSLVWHTALLCHGKDHTLQSTSIREKIHTSLSGEPVAGGRG